jgi:hypothetical protein
MQLVLKAVYARDVDLVEKSSLYNPYRRCEILQKAKWIYAKTDL